MWTIVIIIVVFLIIKGVVDSVKSNEHKKNLNNKEYLISYLREQIEKEYQLEVKTWKIKPEDNELTQLTHGGLLKEAKEVYKRLLASPEILLTDEDGCDVDIEDDEAIHTRINDEFAEIAGAGLRAIDHDLYLKSKKRIEKKNTS